MTEIISLSISDRICKHMNDDHADAVLLYAQFFGENPQATAAELISIDNAGMEIMCLTGGQETSVRVEFDHALESAEDAHQTLITMVKQAKASAAGLEKG